MELVLKVSKVVMDPAFFKTLKKNPVIIAAREQVATGICAAANASLTHKGEPYADYVMFSEPIGDGWNVTVVTDSDHAKNSNAKHNTLTRLAG
jgi:hypothetical protein